MQTVYRKNKEGKAVLTIKTNKKRIKKCAKVD